MTTVTLNQTAGLTPPRPWLTPWQAWGMILIAPYILVFLFFVLYPIGYGFWIARNPQTYVHLFDDPIFARTVVNTIIFLIVGINLKMFVALLLSGFFATRAALDPLAVGAVHSALGGAVDPDHSVAALHAQSGMGHHQSDHLPAHLRGRAELAERSGASRCRCRSSFISGSRCRSGR